MLNKIISNYALSELLEVEGYPLAIADKNGVILWFNSSFKADTELSKIKGRSLFELFKIENEEDLKVLQKHKTLQISSLYQNQNLKIIPLANKNKLDGYFIRINRSHTQRSLSEKHENIIQKNIEFQKELNEFLETISEENSLDIISTDMLIRVEKITNSRAGLIIFYDPDKKYEIKFHDPKEYISNKLEVEQEIKSSFSFLTKWININRKSLIITSAPNSIGFNLANVLSSDYLLITPCFFQKSLLAAIILGRKEKKYTHNEVIYIDKFASLLGIIINSIKTYELNTALEEKIKQGQKLETIGKLASGMAHDFNNLLSGIFGSLDLLKKRTPQTEKISRLIDNIENCTVRARDLTKGLLSFGKPTPKQNELIKPNSLISELSKVVNQTFPKEITFESSAEEKLDDIFCNPTEIYQVLLNLCVNAKEAIKGSGKIVLKAENITVDDKNISNFPWLDKGKYVCFSVSDNGEGISEDNIRKIFNPYFSTKKKETGSGLGLYVTNEIVKSYNGYIDITSKLNEGTTFNVYIPVFVPPAVKHKEEKGEKIIMLADDEVMLRDLLGELLETAGFNVVKVSSGTETLKILTEEMKVDLLIIDYNMPEMNGLECIEQVRKLGYNMPVILSTGSLSVEANIDLKKYGVTKLISKPYEFDTMLLTIRTLI